VEAIGAPGPDIDAEVIALFHDFLTEIGLQGAATHLSSIGCRKCRPAFSEALREFFKPKLDDLCEFCQARYETNPLRILDCGVPADVGARVGAPSALDHICGECRAHFDAVVALLTELDIPHEVDPTIVRGLDYYTRTTFEVVHPSLGAQNVIMGGGRYDGLAEALGGPAIPGIGIASGLERLLLVLGEQGASGGPDVYVAAASEQARGSAFGLALELRRAGLSVEVDYTGRALRAQMREANRLGARTAALIGEDEMEAGTVTLRDMDSGEQKTLPRGELAAELTQARREMPSQPGDASAAEANP
jgi:histidyl-tRNA synthetase